MGHTKDFFKAKKGWSILKDKIIDYYLEPYIAKILTTGKPLIIVDCFAGKGLFDDGSVGSPIIIAQHIKKILESNKQNKEISGIFIEKKYVADLERNTSDFKNCYVWSGTFEQNLSKVLSFGTNNNLFIYIDPYGIKSLNFKYFEEIRKKNFNTLEMLINFNSFGFLREGCRLLKYEGIIAGVDDFDDYEIDESNNIENMNNIANGEYWKSTIQDWKNGLISVLEAEERFARGYVQRLREIFKHVVNIPIKQKTSNLPKYRLIFGTNNDDGLILMADNMNKKWKQLLENQRHGQSVLFEFDFPDLSLQPGFDLEEDIIKTLKGQGGSLLLKDLIVILIQRYGISFSEPQYKDVINKMPVRIDRKPTLTPTGKKATSLDYNKYEIKVSLL